ncbi:ABC transporter ATP-binding protein [Tabrizicola sp.]|uniref:ABC transporter ATP-binding protein n=1 Tax=Tabrizicola sp. TaxID=2005166 RepID=UPI001A4099BB|nr:ABC transporter ATP-binding protein [Tabrizicola sp.]MBL9075241.1 ABC transporter ATP-binding protein [Tabrizicola sp.]
MALEVKGLTAGYGPVTVLHGVDFSASPGRITCLMGRNGVGKSTFLKCLMGLIPVSAGAITLDGTALQSLPAHEVPRHGLAYVPQGRRLFGPLTVAENLAVGGLVRGNDRATLNHVLTLFPRLRERLAQTAQTLSGGEQQMLAIARALCLQPKVLLLDEPTEGLQPSMITLIQEAILSLKGQGVAVVLVEQRVDAVLKLADRVAFMVAGRVEETREIKGMAADDLAFRTYVGV